MTANVSVDEWTQRDHPKSALARVIQCAADKRRTEAPELTFLVDLGVEERKHVVAPIAVNKFPCVLAIDEQLIPTLLWPMGNGDVVGLHIADGTHSSLIPEHSRKQPLGRLDQLA